MTDSGTTSATSRLDMTSPSARTISHFFRTSWFRVVLLISAVFFTSLPTSTAHAGNMFSSENKPQKPKKKKGGFTFFVQGKRPKMKFGHGNKAREATRKFTGRNPPTGEKGAKKKDLKKYRGGKETPPRVASGHRGGQNNSPASSRGRRRGSNELTVRHRSPSARGRRSPPRTRIPAPAGGSSRRGRR